MGTSDGKKIYLERFQRIYKDLNEQQRLAVNTIEGPVLVIAGPGTGKTQVLTARIANILLKTDVPSRAILALTFTESGVKTMRERLIWLIGPEAYLVNVHTFHSFCSDIIRDNPDKFILGENLEPLSQLERIQIFREVLDEGDFELLRPFGSRYYYVRSLIKNVQDLKREGVSSGDFEGILNQLHLPIANFQFEEKDLKKNWELLEIYRSYQVKLRNRSRYDFEDMINLVVQAFETDEDLLRRYQEKFQYILLDEFQDTNTAQNKVVTLLSSFWGETANVFAVGDDEQSIYRFQGASLENILYFKKLYPGAVTISLRESYRSNQGVLDAAFSLIQKNRVQLSAFLKGIERRLVSAVSVGETSHQTNLAALRIGHFSSGITEAFFVASKIKELISSGISPSSIVIIYRNNNDATQFADILSRLGVRFDLSGGEDVLKDHDLDKLLRLLEVILKVRRKEEDLDLFTAFNYEFLAKQFGFSYLDSLKLARFASDLKVNFLEAITRPELAKGKIVANPASFLSFLSKLVDWQREAANSTFVAFFEKVVNESGYLNWLLGRPDSVEKLNRLNSFFSEVKRLNSADHRLNLEDFLDNLKILRESGISIDEEDLNIKTEAVVLTTAHGAKGLEFDYVFIVKAIDGRFGNNKVRELIKLPPDILPLIEGVSSASETDESLNEDERRLFYVALTRAKRGVFISLADSYSSDSYPREALPSMFISEIEEASKSDLKIDSYEKEAQQLLAELLRPVEAEVTSLEEKDFLRSVLADFRLSVTALNSYLECPYKFKLNSLLRTPRAKDKSLAFGSAVHRALELLLRDYKNTGRLPVSQYLLDQFEVALQSEILSKADLIDLLKKGRKILKSYYDFYKEAFIRPIFTEKFFGYGFSKIYLGDIPLTGKVDRIDPLENQIGGRPAVKVVDYKTGRVRSRAEIEGLTKKNDLSYKRQLIFYKILADLDSTFNYEVVAAELDFVEGKEGKFTRHSFTVSQEETNELKKIIKEVTRKIRNLEFPRTTDYDRCTYCEFKAHCWPEGMPAKTNAQLELFGETKE